MKQVIAAVLLAAFTASAQDGIPWLDTKEPAVTKVFVGEIVDGKGDPLRIGPGLFLNEHASLVVARNIQALQVENAKLREAQPIVVEGPSVGSLIIGGLLILSAGVAAGKLLR